MRQSKNNARKNLKLGKLRNTSTATNAVSAIRKIWVKPGIFNLFCTIAPFWKMWDEIAPWFDVFFHYNLVKSKKKGFHQWRTQDLAKRGPQPDVWGWNPQPPETKGVWGRSSQPPINFYTFHIKKIVILTYFSPKKGMQWVQSLWTVTMDCMQWAQSLWTKQKCFRSLCLKAEAWLK